ncbi:MAG TPA: SusC/RagA family TonB-linked outer membrane protein [Longimicrobium sp.]|nr:SusC/RagA family TonB-linked outer membrane protein [Longimicrobium sp.]
MALGRKLFLLLVGALLAGAAQLSAQPSTGTVAGRVVEAAGGQPLAGVSVSVGGRSTQTGPDGRFSLAVPAGTHTVRATRLGYAPAEQAVTVAAGQTATVELRLGAQAVRMQEVVAIGYGERRVRDITGSVAPVSEEQFNTGRVVSPDQLIQGKVAGVQVVNSGEPGGGANIRVRGGTSVNAGNEPLIVLDGVPLPQGGGLSAGRNPLNFVNPEDIARITVLKDAASTAIYGSRGANGVIMVETKAGSAVGPQFEYASSFSTSTITREPELLSADQFRAAVQQYAPGRAGFLGSAETDWRGEVTRDAVGQQHEVAVQGAGQNLSYRMSLNYLDQKGVLEGTDTERLSAALTYTHRLFDNHLTLRANVRGARTDDQFTPGPVLGAATVFDPTQPIRRDDGSWYESTAFVLGPNNPVAELAQVYDQGTTYRSVGNLEAVYRLPFLEELATTVRVGFDVAKSERWHFYPSTLQAQQENFPGCEGGPCDHTGMVDRSNPSEINSLIDVFGTYTKALDRWNSTVEATAGYSWEQGRGDRPYFFARGLHTDLLGPYGVPASDLYESRIDFNENRLAAFFGRLNWTLADRWLLTLSVRRDGSSRFAPGNQWGTYPAAALGWRVSEEPFLDRFGWLSDLKLRASWGVNGNQFIGDYLWVPNYRIGDARSQAQFGDEFVTTIRPTAVDPEIQWEKTTSTNVGFDYGLLDDRITGSVDYYVKDTKDLIFPISVAAGTYVSNQVITNVGNVRNRGLELQLNADVLRAVDEGGLRWTASFNASTNRNRLVTLNPFGNGAEQQGWGEIAGGVGSRIEVLQPGYALYTFHVFRHKRDENGRPIYADVDDNGVINDNDLYEDQDGVAGITQADRVPMENPAPDWIFGHTSSFGYRGFDLGFTMRAHLGNHVYNNLASSQGFYDVLNQAGGLVNLHSSVLDNQFRTAQYFSDVYVEDASFLKMDNLTLGYQVPRRRGFQSMRVYGTVQNVFTWTNYSGIDPEAGLYGIDLTIYPRSRTFTAGVSIGF